MKKGDLLGNRYEIIEKIGRGGMGAVYRAYDKYLGDIIALKVLSLSLGDQSSDALERFKREAKAGMRITHENVVRIHDIGEHEGITYISMEFIHGANLKSIISEQGALPRKHALLITKQICKALQASHNKGIIHKDIKPPNILIESGNNLVKVVDFGLARGEDMMKVTSTGLLVGTPNYISPEQARGSDIDLRCDIYSLGVVMYEMFTGHLPFKANSPLAVCNMHLNEPPATPESVNPNVTPNISKIILKCIEKDPSLRYQDCGEILSDISRCLIMSEDKLNVGDYLGSRFEIVDILGRGGMGVVYKAVDRNFNNMIIALKVLPDELVRDINETRIDESKSAATSLIKEAATAARLNHPNIVRVFNSDEIAGKQYISMEFIEGHNFAQILNKKSKLSMKEFVNYSIQICKALGYAHANNVIHRDIKPSNFMLTKEDIVKITDFGIAQIAESTTKVTKSATTGTLVYMSPQQLLGQKIDIRSDIYSLGILFYEFLTGKPPFISGDTTYQHINVSPKPPSNVAKGIPEEINTIVMKCIQKEPGNRYQTCEEILVSIINAVNKSEIEDLKQISSTFKLTLPKKSQKQLFKFIGIGMLALIAIITSILFTLRDHGDTESIPKLNMQALDLFMERKYQEAKEKWDKILELDPEQLQAIKGVEQVTNKLKAEDLHQEAKHFFMLGNAADDKKAIEKWGQALKLDPTHPDAESYYQKTLKIESHRDEMKRSMKKAQTLFLDKKYEDAKNEWEWVYSIDSRNREAQKGLALIKQKHEIQQSIALATSYFTEGLYQKAVNQWSNVLQLDPNNEQALYSLKKAEKQLLIEQKNAKAYSLFNDKEYKKASEIWSSLLEENPSHPSKDKWIQLIVNTEKKIKASNPVKIANLHMQAISFLADKKHEEAISRWEEILVLDAQDELAQQKIKETKKILDLISEIEVLITNAVNFRKEGKYEKAVQEFKLVLQKDPQNEQAQIQLKEVDEILDKQRQIVSLMTDAKALFNEKKYDEAITKWKVVLFIDPDNTPAKRGIEEIELLLKVKRKNSHANRFFVARQYHEAIEVWQQILVIDKHNKYALEKIAETEKFLKIETLTKNAKLYLEDEEYKKAINEWNKILQLNPNNRNVQAEIKMAMAQLEIKGLHESASKYYENKKYQNALDTLNKILEIDPSNYLANKKVQDIKNLQKNQMISKLLNQTDKLDQEGKYDEAITVLKSILDTDPGNINAKQKLKNVGTKQANLKRQQQLIKNLFSKANEFQNNGWFEEAIEKWRQILELDPENQDALQNINTTTQKLDLIASSLSKSSDYFRNGDYHHAVEVWEVILKLDANNIQAREGIEKTNRQLQLMKQIEALHANANALFDNRKYNAAIAEWDKVLTLDQDDLKAIQGIEKSNKMLDIEKLLTKAKMFFSQKQYQHAIEEWEKVLQLDSTNLIANQGIEEVREVKKKIDTLNVNAEKLTKEGKYKEALDQWRLVIKLDPESQDALQNIPEAEKKLNIIDSSLAKASNYYNQNDYQHAKKFWEDVLKLDAKNIQAHEGIEKANKQLQLMKQIEALHANANALFDNRKYNAAIAEWNKVLTLNPKDIKATEAITNSNKILKTELLHNNAMSFLNQKKYKLAINEWEKALQFDPVNLKAKQCIETVRSIQKKFNTLRKSANKAMYQGNYKEAITKWQSILALLPKDEKALLGLEEANKQLDIVNFNILALDYLKIGAYKDAIQEWEKILKFEPEHVQAQEGIQKAKAAEEKQKKINLLHSEGLALFNKENYSEAISMWQRVLVLDPDNLKAKQNIQNANEANALLVKKEQTIKSLHANAKNSLKAKDFEVAIFNWNKLLDLDPENQNAKQGINQANKGLEKSQIIKSLHTKANNFFEKEMYQDAMKQWKSVIELDSSDKKAKEGILKVETMQARLLNIQASELFNDGSTEKAIDLWEEVLALNPKDQTTEKNIQKARDRIIWLGQIHELNTKASNFLSQQRFQEAMNLWNQVIELDNKNQIALEGIEIIQIQKTQLITDLKDKAFKLFKDNKLVDAIKMWQDVLLLIPDDQTAKSYLVKAQEAFEKQRESEKNQGIIKQLFSKAEAYFKQQRYTVPPNGNAFQMYNEILKIDPNNELAKNGIIRIVQEYKLRGDKAFKEESYSRAKGFYERILLVQPENIEGKALLEKNEKFLKRQQKIDELHVQASQLFSSKDYIGAIDTWQMVKELNPANREADLGIRRARDKMLEESLSKASGFFKNCNYKDAVITWKSILESNPNNRDAAEGIKVTDQIKKLKAHALSLYENSKYQDALVKWEKVSKMNPSDRDTIRGIESASMKIGIPTKILEEMKNDDFTSVIEWLNKGGSVNARNKDGLTLLMVAAWNGYTNTMQILLNRGADVNAKSRSGETALMLTALYGHTNAVNTLLKKGADVNTKSVDGNTALMRAALAGYTDTVKTLLDKGANVNAKNNNEDTSLTVAARMGHSETVKTLTDKGAQVNIKNKNGNTALILAVEKDRVYTVQALLNSGANVNAKNKNGDTALTVATYKNYTKTVKILKKAGAK